MSLGVDLRLPDWPEVPYLAKDAVVSHANVKIVSAKVRRVTILVDFLRSEPSFRLLDTGPLPSTERSCAGRGLAPVVRSADVSPQFL